MLIHNPKELALFVKEYRKKQKLTQGAAGYSVGIKQATVSAFENKPESTKIETLFRILSAVGVELHVNGKDKESIERLNQPWTEEW